MTPNGRKPWYRSSTFWIFVGLFLGVLLGGFLPADRHPWAYNVFRFMSKAFISLIKGLIVPLLFSTIVVGIAQTGDVKAVGRMGGKALLYFEVVTTLALVIGLVIANTVQPGAGLVLDPGSHVALAKAKTGWEIALHVFPSNLVQHAAEGDILPVVIFATLFGIGLTRIGDRGAPVLAFFDGVAQTMFKYTDMVMTLTPLGVFGAMAYNVSAMAGGQGTALKGWPAVFHLLRQYSLFVGSLYLALAVLVGLVFVPVMLACGIRVWGFLKAIKDPALTAFSTASSEAALPKLLEEVVRFGVPRRVASFVIPTGYSFNLDGSTLYLVLASLTIAQAAKIPMTLTQQILMVLTFMLTSKGVAGVPRATLVIIAGTCASFGLPGEAGIALLLAVDEINDMARTTVNVVGNGLASVVIAKWEGLFGTEDAMEETA
ncbi:dicarboxylate/amino acid:cation symporter [Mesoterricola sediminis]|uniref:Proton glutamate symport protein n=1 Tax=Mesoterricola sediminis TaxID=2927980 RepID=A0AA48HBE8_9BACT|nr:cation:dicarboxylase symporter family transporter [Mesoterricola sediminis]BDU75213.1 proton glutamate symport protein [Mesoterricola sediminis]